MVTTYHGSCARSTIATIMRGEHRAAGKFPGLSFSHRRIRRSTRPAASVALASPARDCAIPWPGAAMAVRITRMMVTRPFGVLKKALRAYAPWRRPRVSYRSNSGVTISPSTPSAIQQSMPSSGPRTKAAVASASANIAPDATTVALATAGRGSGARVQNVMFAPCAVLRLESAFVIAGRAHRLVRNAEARRSARLRFADGECQQTTARPARSSLPDTGRRRHRWRNP